MKFLILLLIITSCSTSLTRGPASEDSSSQTCFGAVSSIYKLPNDYNFLFRSVINSKSKISYWINFDRVKKEVESLPSKFPNELELVDIGKYDGESIYRINIPGWGKNEKHNILISAGVHGNESAGVATALNFIQNNIYNKFIRNNFNIVIIPYLNPGGLKNNLRRLNNDIDLNRTFKHKHEQGPTEIAQDSLIGENFSIALDLHEAPLRDKFFIIKSNVDDDSITTNVLKSVDQKYLYTASNNQYPNHMPSATDPKINSYELLAPGEVQSSNKGTVKGFYHSDLGVKYSYTLEAPGLFNLNQKIDIYTNIVEQYFQQFLELYNK